MSTRVSYLIAVNQDLNAHHDSHATAKTPEEIIQTLAAQADPTRNKMYTQWLVGQYSSKLFRQEDAPRYHDTLSLFHKYKRKLAVEMRDISKYKRLSDLQTTIEPFIGTAATNKEQIAHAKSTLDIQGQHELRYKDSKIEIYALMSKEASIKLYASKTAKQPGVFPTEWCTAFTDSRRNYFDDYKNLFVIRRLSDDAVFQYTIGNTSQFMDAKDETISDSDWNSIKESVHKAWLDKGCWTH